MKLASLLADPRRLLFDLDTLDYEDDLYKFFEASWPIYDPAPFVGNWHLQAIAEHLQAVTEGKIRRLLINIPPRCSKTLLTQVAWPAWTWARRQVSPLSGPQVKFMCLSYAGDFADEVATTARRLIGSDWYQARWGERVQISPTQDAKGRFDTLAGGVRIATSFTGQHLGRGADIKVIDDPHKVKEVESDLVRQSVLQTYDEALKNRVTDPRTSAEVTIMQRLHEADLSGHILDEDDRELVHLCLPMEYDPKRHCHTVLGFEDPRSFDGELLWPQVWGERELRPFKAQPYMWAGQYQQTPVPRGGGLFKRDWWQLWPPEGEREQPAHCNICQGRGEFAARGSDGRPRLMKCQACGGTGVPAAPILAFPPMEYIVASVDTAMSAKEENDWSACTVWGLWRDQRNNPKLMLMDAWQVHAEFWGVTEKIIATCRKRRVDRLLIEAKNTGFAVAQEIIRLCGQEEWGTSLQPVKGDKTARAYSVQHLLENGMVYAPERKWSDLVINEMATFPRGEHDDLTDTATQAWSYLRRHSMAQLPSEREADLRQHAVPYGERVSAAPYDV